MSSCRRGDSMSSRSEKALEQAAEAGLDGLLVTPGPDLVYFTGLRPPVTERLTMHTARTVAVVE